MSGAFWGDLLGGTQLDHKNTKSVPIRKTRVPFCAGAFPCSVALVFGFGMFLWKVQHGASEGVENMYRTNAVLLVL